MDLTQTILVAVACWQVVDLWRHSKLLAWVRCRLVRLPYPIGYMLNCAYCFSIWAAALLTFVSCSHWVGQTVVAGLAASKLANLLNDLTTPVNKIPRWSCAEQIEEEAKKYGTDTEIV